MAFIIHCVEVMITIEKIKVYIKYSGDIDMWARFGRRKEKENFSDNDWSLIEDLLQTLEIVEKGLASEGFKSKVLEKLEKSCDSIETQQKLKDLVGKW